MNSQQIVNIADVEHNIQFSINLDGEQLEIHNIHTILMK